MIRSHTILLLFVITNALFGCGNRTEEKDPQKAAALHPHVTLEQFDGLPPEIDGCACYFADTRNNFNDHLFIYADNYGDAAYVKMDGEMITFRLLEEKQTGGRGRVKRFQHGEYVLTVTMQQVSQLDETWQQEGRLELFHNNTLVYAQPFFGECGC